MFMQIYRYVFAIYINHMWAVATTMYYELFKQKTLC